MLRQYPSMSEICQAMCDPSTCLYDPVISAGTVAKNKLGMADARSGGFAVVFKVTDRKTGRAWAVRVFHRDSEGRSNRYQIITRNIQKLRNVGYFVPFEFQKNGIMINGQTYEIVVMDWLQGGEELGEFITNHLKDCVALQNVRIALLKLHRDLTNAGVAHGDIQPANMRIFENGKKIKLLDYDGFYCSELKPYGAVEVGCANFQHPQRADSGYWDIGIDRFSFIALDVALKVLSAAPTLWALTKSADRDAVLFSDVDYKDPARSEVFKLAKQVSGCRAAVSALESICSHSIRNVPDPGSYAIPSYCAPVNRHNVTPLAKTVPRYVKPRRFDWRKLTFCRVLMLVGAVAVVSLGAGAGLSALMTREFDLQSESAASGNQFGCVKRHRKVENVVHEEILRNKDGPIYEQKGIRDDLILPCLTCRGYGYVIVRLSGGRRIRMGCGDCNGRGVWYSGVKKVETKKYFGGKAGGGLAWP